MCTRVSASRSKYASRACVRNRRPPALVKMDIEGFEWQILNAVLNAPAHIRPDQVRRRRHACARADSRAGIETSVYTLRVKRYVRARSCIGRRRASRADGDEAAPVVGSVQVTRGGARSRWNDRPCGVLHRSPAGQPSLPMVYRTAARARSRYAAAVGRLPESRRYAQAASAAGSLLGSLLGSSTQHSRYVIALE